MMVSAGGILGIGVLDHVIIGRKSPSKERDYVGLREAGAMGTGDG